MNLHRVCRLCFLRLQNPWNIFTTPELLNKILRFADIQIQEDDGLPCNICEACYLKVQIADKFRSDVEKADTRIRTFILEQIASGTTCRGLLNRITRTRANVYKWCHENSADIFQTDLRTGLKSIELIRNTSSNTEKVCTNFRNGLGIDVASTYEVRQSIAKSLIYSSTAGKTLAESYKILVDQCFAQSAHEDFLLPSFYTACNESNLQKISQEFSGGKSNNLERVVNDNDKSAVSVTRTIIDYDCETKRTSPASSKNANELAKAHTDPLNLLKIKIVRPLGNRKVDELFETRRSLTSLPKKSRVGNTRKLGESQKKETSDSARVSKCPKVSVSLKSSTCNAVAKSKKEISVAPQITSSCRRNMTNCPICCRICAGVRGVQIHLKSHRAIKCPICKVPTLTKEQYKNHMKQHINTCDSQMPFQCKTCDRTFERNVDLSTHMRSHLRNA